MIELRGVHVHNLKHVDLDIPHHKLIALCGVSGSGKTSLALDTLYAEGQRRYIESFSASTRQFLQRLDKPAADRIDGLPASIAVTRDDVSRSNRATIGTTTEIVDYLRLLFAKIGRLACPTCGRPVERTSPEAAARQLEQLPEGSRLMVAFAAAPGEGEAVGSLVEKLQASGFVRAVVDGRTVQLVELKTLSPHPNPLPNGEGTGELLAVVDRLTTGSQGAKRLLDSLETAFHHGGGRAVALIESAGPSAAIRIDDRSWQRFDFSSRLECTTCGRTFADPEPRRFSFSSPLGACPTCEGFGNLVDWDLDLIVPDPRKTIREGAIAAWNTPAYKHELDELLALADEYQIPVDVPFRELPAEAVALVRQGVPERKFGGLRGFFQWLEKRKYKLHLRVFLNRWRSTSTCPTCRGARLNAEALAWRIQGKNIAEVSALQIDVGARFIAEMPLREHEARLARLLLTQIRSRLAFLQQVGLGYLALDRPLKTLSGGEAQRVSLTSALGSSLVNMLYVLDEPSVGLHPRDVGRLVEAIRALRDRGNSVVVVEHEEGVLRAADQLIEIGPGA